MDLTCRCNPLMNYTCVACKVKRGDYRTWQCSVPRCEREAKEAGLCLTHWNDTAQRRTA